MADAKVTVIARARAKAGLEEQLRQEITALIAPTRAEPGCINYDLHQSASDPALFMLHENWVSMHALEEHLAMPYLEAFKAKAPDLLAEPLDLSFWTMI
ncbi:putative quinol monooxygenase [Geobacter pickeringii]|uniref:Antibiotic biosynthesis monooxygenase n=1 Tax=Geobacter pickeringii TaxID=345632 RepID=A0A0B5B8S0_9BACT|nr:putative quinol monooxygenase [Geobacter pickeringii]AJE03103.1 antibiotic biosynthesis monooxygenase [Geobacter pickeringii]